MKTDNYVKFSLKNNPDGPGYRVLLNGQDVSRGTTNLQMNLDGTNGTVALTFIAHEIDVDGDFAVRCTKMRAGGVIDEN